MISYGTSLTDMVLDPWFLNPDGWTWQNLELRKRRGFMAEFPKFDHHHAVNDEMGNTEGN